MLHRHERVKAGRLDGFAGLCEQSYTAEVTRDLCDSALHCNTTLTRPACTTTHNSAQSPMCLPHGKPAPDQTTHRSSRSSSSSRRWASWAGKRAMYAMKSSCQAALAAATAAAHRSDNATVLLLGLPPGSAPEAGAGVGAAAAFACLSPLKPVRRRPVLIQPPRDDLNQCQYTELCYTLARKLHSLVR